MFNNKLGVSNQFDLVKEEECITKIKALKLFDMNKLNDSEYT